MKKALILFFTFFCFGTLNAQSLKFYKSLISSNTDAVLSLLKDSGYKLKKEIPNEGCLGYNLSNGETIVLYNVCYNDEGNVINLNVIERNLKSIYKKFNEAMNDASMTPKTSTIETNTSFIFEKDSLEMFFVFNHFRNIYYMEISNANRYESIKNSFESSANFNSETNGISLMMKILNETNSKGQSLEQVLKDAPIRSDFNILDSKQAIEYIVSLRNSEEFTKLKKLVDTHLLSDEFYAKKIKTSFLKSLKWFEVENSYNDRFEEALFKITTENKQFKSLIMFNYIINSIKEMKND